MKKLSLIALAMFLIAGTSSLFAQEHAEVGVFGDYLNLRDLGQGFWGVGARAGFNVAPHVTLEADMAYDFAQNFSNSSSTGVGTSFTTTPTMHLLHGTFGPKLHTRLGPVRVFALAKGGFITFGRGGNTSFNSFTGTLSQFNTGRTDGVFYPGAGFDVGSHWLGFRVEAGDFMYFNNGAHHNVRVTFGPQFTF